MRAEVKKRFLISLGVGVVLEALLLPFAWTVLFGADRSMRAIDALAILTQLPVGWILKLVGVSINQWLGLVVLFVLQSLFYAALCYVVLHLLARGKRNTIIRVLVAIGFGMALEAMLIGPVIGMDPNKTYLSYYIYAGLLTLSQLPWLWILERQGGHWDWSMWVPLYVLQSLFFATLCYPVIYLLARWWRKNDFR